MKCTYHHPTVAGAKCGIETHRFAHEWVKHEAGEFHPMVLYIFFQPLVNGDLIDEKYRITQHNLDNLDALVCPLHLPEWREYVANTTKACAVAATRRRGAIMNLEVEFDDVVNSVTLNAMQMQAEVAIKNALPFVKSVVVTSSRARKETITTKKAK